MKRRDFIRGAMAGSVLAFLPRPRLLAQGTALPQAGSDPLDFARQELRELIGTIAGGENLLVPVAVDATLPEFAFSIQRTGNRIQLAGHGPSEVLSAVYTALEQMGYRFEITGPVAPDSLNVAAIPETRQVIRPAIQRRGIRQHINFNMDVSGYPIEEAKAYIRNLARLRYNYMTFHSYPCHWTRDRYGNRSTFPDFAEWMKAYHPQPDDLVTGAYFYGCEFRIPDHPLVRPHVRFNTTYFCAPEFEEVIHTQPQRGEKAQAWLRALMAEAKRCGMTLHFSTELKQIDDRYNQGLVERILTDFPQIEWLELNSAEGGDFHGEGAEAANRAMAERIIHEPDDAALNAAYSLGKAQAPLCDQIRNYANCIRVIRRLQAQDWEKTHGVKLVCGSYATDPPTIKVEMDLAEKYLPADQILSIMPWYGSIGVNAHVQQSTIKPELLKRMMVHSWLELDGFMMLQQQATTGISELAHYLTQQTGGAPYGIVCNHWRTTPNALSFRHLTELSFDSSLTPQVFFERTAAQLGIAASAAASFALAMLAIDALGDVRGHLPGNLGFPLGWEVDAARRDLGQISWWNRADLESLRARFQEIHADLETCRQGCSNPHGQTLLDQLLNGTLCSVAHLEAVLALKPIAEKYFDPATKRVRDGLTDADTAFIAERAAEADGYFQRYMQLLGQRVVDRGEEAMLVTYYWAPLVFCHNILAIYGGRGQVIQKNSEGNVVPQPLNTKDQRALGI